MLSSSSVLVDIADIRGVAEAVPNTDEVWNMLKATQLGTVTCSTGGALVECIGSCVSTCVVGMTVAVGVGVGTVARVIMGLILA